MEELTLRDIGRFVAFPLSMMGLLLFFEVSDPFFVLGWVGGLMLACAWWRRRQCSLSLVDAFVLLWLCYEWVQLCFLVPENPYSAQLRIGATTAVML